MRPAREEVSGSMASGQHSAASGPRSLWVFSSLLLAVQGAWPFVLEMVL